MNTKFDPNVMAQLLSAADMPIERPDIWTKVVFLDGKTHAISPAIARKVLFVNNNLTRPGEDRIAFQENISQSFDSLMHTLRRRSGVKA